MDPTDPLMDYAPADWLANGTDWSLMPGPQSDGTYVTPSTAQQINNPANTAGNSSPMSTQTYNLLTQGINGAFNLAALSQMVDYRKYEATNGGLFMQGQGAYLPRAGAPVLNPNMTMMLLLFAGVVFLMKD